MAEVHHFAFGWVNPTLAYVMSFLGCLLGLVFATRAREVRGATRARWLALAAVAIGGTGIWLMHFMAMVGFDVPATVVRYDVPMTMASLVLAVVIVGVGLFIVGTGEQRLWKLLLGGPVTGLGVAAMHYAGMAAMHLGGVISYDHTRVTLSVAIAIVAATAALWFALVIRGATATISAALLMGAAVTCMHYTGMSAIRVRLTQQPGQIPGVSPFVMLMPISILACALITALAYMTVGFSVRRENPGRAVVEPPADRSAGRIPAQATGPAAGRSRAAGLTRPPLARHD